MPNGNGEKAVKRPTSDIDQRLVAQEADLAELTSNPDWPDSGSAEPAVSLEDVGRFLRSRIRYLSGPEDMAQMALIARGYGHVAEVSNHLVRSPECPAESVVSLLEARVGDLDFVWYAMIKHSHQLGPETVAWAYDNHGSDNWVFVASLASHYQLADSLRERAYDDHGQRLRFARILVRTQANLSSEIIARVAQDHGNHPELVVELAGCQPGLEEDIIRSLYENHCYHSGFLNALAHCQPGFPEDQSAKPWLIIVTPRRLTPALCAWKITTCACRQSH